MTPLLLALTTLQLQKFLHTVETESALYGLHLNTTKTEVLEDPRYDTPILHVKNGCQVPVSTKVKYLGVHVSWTKPFEAASLHRRALPEEAFKKLRLVWNSSMNFKEKTQIFQSVFIGTLIYGLDTLSLTTSRLQRVDAYYFRFLRRICKIPASYYSRVTNHTAWRQAGYPQRPSDRIHKLERELIAQVFQAPDTDPMHNVVFAAFRDGRRRGRPTAHWADTVCRRHYVDLFSQTDHTADRHRVYALIARQISEQAPMRDRRARP